MIQGISITTEACPHGGDLNRIHNTLQLLKQAGFSLIDLSLQGAISPDSPLRGDDWQQWCDDLAQYAEKEGLRFVQAHAPACNLPSPNVANAADKLAMVKRTIYAAGRLCIPWIVVHPGTDYQATDAENDYQQNRAFFRQLLVCAAEAGTGIAIENLFDTYHAPLDGYAGVRSDERVDRRSISRRRYGADPSDIRRLADTLSAEGLPVGLCWDTGHANLSGIRQGDALRKLGQRVKVLHLHDNHAFEDSHLTPYAGSVPWEEITGALREIGYSGTLNLECGGFTNSLPSSLVVPGLTYAHAAAKELFRKLE